MIIVQKITTSLLAKLYKLCDQLLINKYGTDLIGVLSLDIENKTETVMMLLMQFNEVKQLIETYDLYDFLYEFVDDLSKKKIFKLSNDDLSLTKKKPEEIQDLHTLLTEKQLKSIFSALRNNVELYDKLYRDKILLIKSSIGRNEKITISPARFFHILGFEEKLIVPRNQAGFDEFKRVFSPSDDIRSLLSDRKDLYSVLHLMIEREETIIDAVLNGKLNHTLNFPKIEMKNYGFERIGILEHSSGMIFYDSSISNVNNSYLQSDLFLLQDFIKNYKLDFIFEAYRPYKHSKKDTMNGYSSLPSIPVSDAESLFISQKGENSDFLVGQQASISESVGSYHPKSFDYTITLDDGSEGPTGDPEDYIEFSAEDKMRITQSIIEGLPMLDNTHLLELYNDLQNNLGKGKGGRK